MIIDEIKKANIEAMKAHDADSRSAFSILISRYMELKTSGANKEVSDADMVHIIQKLDKELDEEKSSYLKAGRNEAIAALEAQKKALARFLPKQLEEDEIKAIIATLEDKSLPSVMKHFKSNYAGKVDMGLVSKIARG